MMTKTGLYEIVKPTTPESNKSVNNYGWNVIRHQANAAWPDREIVTSFKRDHLGTLYNPNFAALAKACGANGEQVIRPGDFKEVLHHAIQTNEPFVIDVVVDRDAKAASTGTWVLPPFSHPEPSYGTRNLRA
ncbi:MAG: thiamine pyrophosphate-dependent enzyme [Candidatus Tectomicrobia bacterium]|nr:thiamine pyrophosphate-dependent enzyme [Candidatus Tectomicrobia bacterium]